ncbi:MAG TPA: UDP-N-acetylmuramoyl-L-alanyl-D-glutamate--2,6-diaminopimelate ligase [Acidimicrobiales bacterium]|nr:UDP-N-acetylmuramoyl-L-alanyl-D-glutamate--2,6-diaminopimelate ligase [Acidimicrobiales bacterium]
MDRLFEGVEVTQQRGDIAATEVTSIELDSRNVVPGSLFFCLPGLQADGHDFAAAAVDSGAVGLVVERLLPLPVPQAVVAPGTARHAMARIAGNFYGDPARSLLTIGVTGTNGKTTVTHLLATILDAHDMPCAVIGTLDGARTTPEAPVIQKILDGARHGGRKAAAIEVSSHALTQGRVDGIHFAAAVFTNLSHDHLDHHQTMEAYFTAKALLFEPQRTSLAVINTDDQWGRRLLDGVRVPAVSFSSGDATAVRTTSGRTTFSWRGHAVALALTGAYHVTNALAAATTAVALGVPEETVVRGLARARPVPGRFEVVDVPASFTVVVDYAHTPDGLEVALDSARRLAGDNRVLCVFGCGGDRDRAKRPLMAAVASNAADVTVITSDNPRHEDPRAIVEEVRRGVADEAAVIVEPDRALAISRAVGLARPGDVVLVAGKGHETFLEIAERHLPFDDRLVVADAVRRLDPAPSEMTP